jgi:hypothetical protein
MGARLGRARKRLIITSENRHGTFHFIFGILAFGTGYYTRQEFYTNHNLLILLAVLLGSFIPDIDHLLYQFGYGRKKDYAKICRNFLNKRDLKGYINFVKQNHKHNTKIYSHNLGSFVIALFLSSYFVHTLHNIFYSMFFLAWAFHYLYDILEDLLFFKRLNKNWFFVFGK